MDCCLFAVEQIALFERRIVDVLSGKVLFVCPQDVRFASKNVNYRMSRKRVNIRHKDVKDKQKTSLSC